MPLLSSSACLALLAGLGVIVASCVTTEDAAVPPRDAVPVFSSVTETADQPRFAAEPWAVRHIGVVPDAALFVEGVPAVGDTLVVELFDGEQVDASVTAVDPGVAHLNVRAQALEPHSGAVLLSIGDDRLAGSLRLAGRPHHYYVRYDESLAHHFLVEVDPAREDVVPEAPPEEEPPGRP